MKYNTETRISSGVMNKKHYESERCRVSCSLGGVGRANILILQKGEMSNMCGYAYTNDILKQN